MEDMVVPGERSRKSMGSRAGGVGGGGVGVGVDAGGVGLEGARDLPDKKKLQRKSVSFTGEEGYQVRARLPFRLLRVYACGRASYVVVVVLLVCYLFLSVLLLLLLMF